MTGQQPEPTFSVIIPLFNKGTYILRTVVSVLAQTYPAGEILVVDDGSTDGGAEALVTAALPGVRILRKANGGVSSARNAGAAAAAYPYLVFLDADDEWDVDALTTFRQLVLDYPKAGLYGVNNRFVYPDGRVLVDPYPELFGSAASGILPDYFAVFARHRRSPFSNSGCCIPARVFQEVGGYREGVRLTEDSDLWCRIALLHPIAYAKEAKVSYRMDTLGSTHQVFEPQEFQVICTLREALTSPWMPEALRASAARLMAFQKLNHLKRALYAGRRGFVLARLLDPQLLRHQPRQAAMLLMAVLVPGKLLDTLRTRRCR